MLDPEHFDGYVFCIYVPREKVVIFVIFMIFVIFVIVAIFVIFSNLKYLPQFVPLLASVHPFSISLGSNLTGSKQVKDSLFLVGHIDLYSQFHRFLNKCDKIFKKFDIVIIGGR